MSQTELDAAAVAVERGNFAEAERRTAAVLQNDTGDLRALILMGAILDAQQRYPEAEGWYARALKLAPASAPVLNNVANHYLSAGDRKRAGELYRKAVAINPHHPNANRQLAQMSVEESRGVEALRYLDSLPQDSAPDEGTLLVRIKALTLTGKCLEVGKLTHTLAAQAGGDSRVNFSAGLALAECKLYGDAEASFSRALDADPRNYDVLYNLGLAALRAGDSERALSVFEVALRERPQDPDCLYASAQALLKVGRVLDAAAVLAKAGKTAPQRADILLLLAQVSAQLEFYEDAAAGYDRYLQLRPTDDVARRERGLAFACAHEPQKARADLEWYVRRHPADAMAFYELAIAQQFDQREKAFRSLDRALALDANLVEAHYTRAVLNLAENRPAAAIDDLRLVQSRRPENPRVLASLGQAYLDLHQPDQAATILKRALDLAPDAPFVLVQYRRALTDLGQTQEAGAILARLKQPVPDAGKRQTGLIEFLNLPASDQRSRYLANLRQAVADSPNDAQLRLRFAKELFAEGKTAEALDIFRELRQVHDPKLLAAAGTFLLNAQEYQSSREFLDAAVEGDTSLTATRLDLTAALFHLKDPAAALIELEKTPLTDRKGDYYLLRAQLFDAAGNLDEAVKALNRAMQSAPTRASLYLQSAGFLLKHKLYKEALRLLEQASQLLPGNRDILLGQAVTLAVLRREDDARHLIVKMQAGWPEWDRPYLLNGIMLQIQLKSAEARTALEAAIALGARTPGAYYYEALAISQAAPDDYESAEKAISQALRLTSEDPYIFLLGGQIALAHSQYAEAIAQLRRATELLPTLIPARYALRHAYQAVGDEAKAATEITAIQRIAAENVASENNPFPVDDFVFTVR